MKHTRRQALSAVTLAALVAAPQTGVTQTAAAPGQGSEVKGQLTSTLVPSPVSYTAMLPPDYDKAQDLPLLLALHGGDGIAGVDHGAAA